jgi:hypothetical protein
VGGALTVQPVLQRRGRSRLAWGLWIGGSVLGAFFVLLIIGSITEILDDSSGDPAQGDPFGSLVLIPGREQPVEVKEATIGASGGAVKLDDGASVTVPAGALPAQTLLRVERIQPGLEDFDFTVSNSAIYRVTLNGGRPFQPEAPLVLEIPGEVDRTLVLSLDDGRWAAMPLAGTDAVRVELDHFSRRTVMALGASFASGLRTTAEGVLGGFPGRMDLNATIQEKEAAHRKRVEAKSAATQQFFGVGETTKRQHAEICEEFKASLLANSSTLTHTAPEGAPGLLPLTSHLGNANRPSEGDASSKWYWDITSASHDVIRQKVIAAGAGHPISPAAVLRIAIDANGGNVPLGVLAAHNVLKDIAYAGREIADPSATYVGSIQDIPAADGQFVASIETWRRESDHSPSGRYDKLGPVYHIFAAMAARVWGGELYAQGALSVEAFLRSVGWNSDIPDPEKGAADECGRDIGAWLADLAGAVSLNFEPLADKVEVGKEIPLTLTVRNLPEDGLSIALKILSGEGSLSRTAINVSKGSSGSACDVTGRTAVCGLTFTPSKAGEAVVEARSGKTSATVTLGSDPQVTVTVNWSSRSTVGATGFPVGRPHPMAVEVYGSPRGTPETLLEQTPKGTIRYGVGSGTVGCQADSTTPAMATFTTSQLRFGDYKGDDFFIWVESSTLCSLLGDASFLPRITWSAEIKVGDAAPVVCKGSYVNVVPGGRDPGMQRQLGARINLLANPVVTCLAAN